MSLFTSLRNYSVFTILLSCASLAIANSAQAAAFSNNTWNFVGNTDPTANPITDITLTNNVTATPPAEAITFLWQDPVNGIGRFGTDPDDDTTDNSTSASLIWQTFDAAAGDTLSFNWDFDTQDTQEADFGFFGVSQNGGNATVNRLASALVGPIASNPYTYTFGSTGTYTIGIGVSNWTDDTNVSTLALSNINYTAIPTPALLPGLVGVGIGVIRRQRGRD